jgi:hypothetical protein
MVTSTFFARSARIPAERSVWSSSISKRIGVIRSHLARFPVTQPELNRDREGADPKGNPID